MTGKVIGTYRIIQQLGQGLHGTVYQAIEQGREKIVALKAIHAALAQQAAFKQNLRALSALLTPMRHPCLAAFHTILQMGSELYVIREFVEGTPLQEVLQRSSVLACEEAVALAAQILETLSYAHAAGLWHGGIKPNNLILTAERQIKLTDLGLAQAAGTGHFQERLEASVLNYAAPEQLRGEKGDARTDVYALGAVLYEMLTGFPPFRRASAAALRQAHLDETPPSPRTYFPMIPLPLEQAVLRALAKAPAARFATAAEFRRALLSWPEADANADIEATQLSVSELSVATNPLVSAASNPLVAVPTVAFNRTTTADSLANELAKPLAPNDWPQLSSPATSTKASSASALASTGLNDEVIVDLDEAAAGKRGFWKPIAAVTGVAALLGATYAFVRVSNGDGPTLGPTQTVIKVSPTLPPPTPTPTVLEALPTPAALPPTAKTARVKATALPKVAKPVHPTSAAPAPKPKNTQALKSTSTPTPAPTKLAKAKPTPLPIVTKKNPAPTPTPISGKKEKKKNGGVGGFLKGVFGGSGKEKKADANTNTNAKKAESAPKTKKAEPPPKPKKY